MPLSDNELDHMTQFRLPLPVAPVCPQCSYNLTGLIDPRCPECGYQFEWTAVRRRARLRWLEALGLKSLPEDVQFGFYAALAAWGIATLLVLTALLAVGLGSYTLGWLVLVMYVMAMFLAGCGAFLCSHIVKFRRLPEEAREALRIEVPATQAWVGLFVSLLLLLIGLSTCVMMDRLL